MFAHRIIFSKKTVNTAQLVEKVRFRARCAQRIKSRRMARVPPIYRENTHIIYRKGVEANDESIFYPAPCGGTACRPVPAGRYGSAGLCSWGWGFIFWRRFGNDSDRYYRNHGRGEHRTWAKSCCDGFGNGSGQRKHPARRKRAGNRSGKHGKQYSSGSE